MDSEESNSDSPLFQCKVSLLCWPEWVSIGIDQNRSLLDDNRIGHHWKTPIMYREDLFVDIARTLASLCIDWKGLMIEGMPNVMHFRTKSESPSSGRQKTQKNRDENKLPSLILANICLSLECLSCSSSQILFPKIKQQNKVQLTYLTIN